MGLDQLLSGEIGGAVVSIGGAVVSAGVALFAKLWMNRQLESHKHELQNEGNRLAHNLELEILKAQLHTQGIHRVYPELYQLLRKDEQVLREYLDWYCAGSERHPIPEDLSADEYRIKNELYFSERVSRLSSRICSNLTSALIAVQLRGGDWLADLKKKLEEVHMQMDDLRSHMKEELSPK